MKQSELINQFNAGKILVVGQFAHFKKEKVAYRNKVSGAAAVFDKLEYAVLTANGIVFVQPDTRKIPGFDYDKFESPFKPNQKVVIEISSMIVEKGITVIGGTISALE